MAYPCARIAAFCFASIIGLGLGLFVFGAPAARASADDPEVLRSPPTTPLDPEFPDSHLLESFQLGDLGYDWRELLAVVGTERITFLWLVEDERVENGAWVLREQNGTVVASGNVVPLATARPRQAFWDVDLETLTATYPLTMQIQGEGADGTAIDGARSNAVALEPAVNGGGTCFPDFSLGASFEAELEALRSRFNVPALAGGIVTAGQGTRIDATGFRKIEGSMVPVTAFDKWHIGSNTKAMTATLVGLLAAANPASGLNFDTRIADVFPPDEFTINFSYENMTVERLLAHRGGAPTGGQQTDLQNTLLADPNRTLSQRRLDFTLDVLSRPRFIPTPAFPKRYSNAGYVIVAAMLERVYGRSYEALLEDTLFAPLGMVDSGFGAPPPLDTSDQPWGHFTDAGDTFINPSKGDNTPALAPAGTVHATLQDYGKFLRLLLNRSEGSLSISKDLLDRLTTPFDSDQYGYGWGIVENDDGAGGTNRVLAHAGSNGSWFFSAIVHLDEGWARYAVTNVTRFWSPTVYNFQRPPLRDYVDVEDGFVAHGVAAVNAALVMLAEQYTGCPCFGLAGGPFKADGGQLAEGSTLLRTISLPQPTARPVPALPWTLGAVGCGLLLGLGMALRLRRAQRAA